jgi:hypothetical protein
LVSHRLSEEERQRILLTCNQPEFAALPPGQIVPILADPGLYRFRAQLLPSAQRQQPGPPPGAGQASPAAPSGAAAGGQGTQ